MAMRLADTFLVHPRSCFAILFSGQTPRWSLPRFLDIAAGVPMLVRSGVMTIEQMFANVALAGSKRMRSQ